MNRGEFQEVEQLFSKCLPITDHVELCRLYVSYVRRTNDVITGGEKARGIVVQAFEFAVTKVGIDISSGDLWNDYLDFLKAWTPAATWEQQQKTDLIRRVYKRFLVIPTEKIEQVWSTYTKWENEVNASSANKFIAEKSSEFMDARSWNTEWHNATERLLRREVIPIGIHNDNNNLVHTQLQLWYKWIALERENKLNLKDDSSVQQRIEYVYKQAIMALPFVPELWFKFNKFWLRSNEEANSNKCIELLNEALVLNPRSYLLTFQLSEMYEKDNTINKATETYDNLITFLTNDYNNINNQIESITNRELNNKKQEENTGEENNNENDDSDNDDNDDDDSFKNPTFQLSEEDALLLSKLQEKKDELNKAITLVYTKLMMACKRSRGIKEARGVFKQARNNFEAIGYEFYVENALMEYHSDNLKTASKIFELGMKHFKKQGEFLLAYLDFLIMINKGESIKVLFEQGLTALLQDVNIENENLNGDITSGANMRLQESKSKENIKKKNCIKKLIKKFSRYQSVYGDLDLIKSLDSRYEEYFPDDDSIELFSDRYRGHSIDVIKHFDLGKEDTSHEEIDTTAQETKRRKIQNPTVDEFTPEVSNNNNQHTNNKDAVQNQQQPQNFVGNTIYNLLRVLPNSSYFGLPSDHLFNNTKLVELFGNLPNVPTE